MNEALTLKFSTQKDILKGDETSSGRIQDILHIKSDNASLSILIRRKGEVLAKRFSESSGRWINQWQAPIFGAQSNYSVRKYPWFLTDKYGTNHVFLRHPAGIKVFELNINSGLPYVKKDGHFHEVYSLNSFLWGNFFEGKNWFGLMTRNKDDVNLFAATRDSFDPDLPDLFFPMWKAEAFSSEWLNNKSDIFAIRLYNSDLDLIGLRSANGLGIYRIIVNQEDYAVSSVMQTSKFPKQSDDHLFFGHIYNKNIKDVIQLNNSGLFLFSCGQMNEYELISHNYGFAKHNAWTYQYTESVRLFDINMDGRDDLIYTGRNGLTIESYNPIKNSWEVLFNPENILGPERYDTAISTIAPLPPDLMYPSIFTQNSDGKLKWASVEPAPMKLKLQATVNQSKTTTISNPSQTGKVLKLPSNTSQTEVNAEASGNGLIPKEMSRAELTNPPILRWAQQFDSSFLKDNVDLTTGQVRLNIPLIDIFAVTGWRLQFNLNYNSQYDSPSTIGIGWSMPIDQDRIVVDYQGSIFHEDAVYYLITQGRPLQLKYIKSRQNSFQRFEMSENNSKLKVTVTYYPNEQRWVIDGPAEQITYGGAEQAVQWGLGWENWRGIGTDVDNLKPLVTGWYLTKRYDKSNNRALNFEYESEEAVISSKKYTASIRLKFISAENFNLAFDYAKMSAGEYKLPQPINDEGYVNFPVPLATTHYMIGYVVATNRFTQNIRFNSQLYNGKRRLTSAYQTLPSRQEIILDLSYFVVDGKQRLHECKLPSHGVSASFTYERFTPPLVATHMIVYPIRESTKISHGPDYAVMGYSEGSKIILRVLSRDLTKIVFNCTLNSNITCPTARSEITDFVVLAFKNTFGVLVMDKSGSILYMYDKTEDEWVITKILTFMISAKVKFTDTLVVAADSGHIEFVKREDISSPWLTEKLSNLGNVISVAILGNVVVTYDGYNIFLYHYNAVSGWTTKFVSTGLPGSQKALEKFDIDGETYTSYLNLFNDRSLQVVNNLILSSCITEENGQLYVEISVFVLNNEFDVVSSRIIKEPRQSVSNINYAFKNEGSVFNLKYVEDNGLFKIKVNKISGKLIDDMIKSTTNRNRIEDIRTNDDRLVKKQIQELNSAPGWTKLFRKSMLIDFNLYFAQANTHGAYCGDDIDLRFTGTDWEITAIPYTQTVPLGDQLSLQFSGKGKVWVKILKQGTPLKTFKLSAISQLINRYPSYIAYPSQSGSVEVITFKDEHTLGNSYTFHNETISPDSNWQNLITLANSSSTKETFTRLEPYEYRLRPLTTLAAKPSLYVSNVDLSDGDSIRTTGYWRTAESNEEGLTYSETLSIIPGAQKSRNGWYEASRVLSLQSGNVTMAERWFDAEGKLVKPPPHDRNTVTKPKKSSLSHGKLYDSYGRWLVSDFSPYSLADEMVAYYGFESYEKNQIGGSSSGKSFKVKNNGSIIRDTYSFTGHSVLRLNEGASISGAFRPRDQQLTYLAACWVRSVTGLAFEINSPISIFKVIVTTNTGHRLIGLNAQVKKKVRDWYYLEVPIRFTLIKEIHDQFLSKTNQINKDPSFSLTLVVESAESRVIDLDHIRFAPIALDYQIDVYRSLNGRLIETILPNGEVSRKIFDHFEEPIAELKDDWTLLRFSSKKATGKTLASNLVLEPEEGIYETFDESAWQNRWVVKNQSSWQRSFGELSHRASGSDILEAQPNLFDSDYSSFRCFIQMQGLGSSVSFSWRDVDVLKLYRGGNETNFQLFGGTKIKQVSNTGEVVLVLEKNVISFWFDGALLLDQVHLQLIGLPSNKLWSKFSLTFQGAVLLKDCFVINRPRITVEYSNKWGERSQIIQGVDDKSALVSETLYDANGRTAITTKTTKITRFGTEPFLAYHSDFVTNSNPNSLNSVWHTGVLEGVVNTHNRNDKGFAYSQTKYADNPLNEKFAIGMPGKEYAVGSAYQTTFSRDSGQSFLDNIFPAEDGYHQQVKRRQNGSLKISIFDKKNMEVARYIHVPSFNHLLSTYEYDNEGRLVRILPPIYHELAFTSFQLTPWQWGTSHLTNEERQRQETMSTRFNYDASGRLIRKYTPDSGTTEYVYDSRGYQRFNVHMDINNQIESTVFFSYDDSGQLLKSGYLKPTIPLARMRDYVDAQNIPNAIDYQQVEYSDDHPDPASRGREKMFITGTAKSTVLEKLKLNKNEQVTEKRTILAIKGYNTDYISELRKSYFPNGRLSEQVYPIEVNGNTLRMSYKYDRQGQLIAIDESGANTLARFTYNADGTLDSEIIDPSSLNAFERMYSYNSPGFLERIADPYLTETLSYTEEGYGQDGYGDGMVMRTAFNATWAATADERWFQVHDDELGNAQSAICIKALKRNGYIAESGKVLKLFIRHEETAMPLLCGGENAKLIAQRLAEKITPSYYGFRFLYGVHQELVDAKFFNDNTDVLPLGPLSFAKEITSISKEDSKKIWQLLLDNNFIYKDQQRNEAVSATGKRGKSIFRDTGLFYSLKNLNEMYTLYVEPIEKLALSAISKRKTMSREEFAIVFVQWQGLDMQSSRLLYNRQFAIGQEIGTMLINNGYLPSTDATLLSPLETNFTNILNQYRQYLPEIVHLLTHSLAHALGETAFDVESYQIDANGNHRHFYSGFNRIELNYRENTNQIQSLKLNYPDLDGKENIFLMKHDIRGNVIQALHKNIRRIVYHPVTQKTVLIELGDGRTLTFHYDAQGERVVKKVYDSTGVISQKISYLRDEQGNVLVDKQTKYFGSNIQTVTTAYVYGPRGMLGFYRNNVFHSVITDHLGSTRIIIRDGKVVAAYDFMPYGQIMRSFGSHPDFGIRYLFTGQEWDEETGLYNYHARLYDPVIGRFFQPDPQAQYFSPYKYAGNSPASLTDPDGEFAMLIAIGIGALAGAYLFGAAANNRWNPRDWDFKDPGTWLGIGGGALAGGMLPVGFAASAAAIGTTAIGTAVTVVVGSSVSFLTMAGVNQDWNPRKWDFTRPDTWSAMFQGFSTGSGLPGGVAMMHKFANVGKVLASGKEVVFGKALVSFSNKLGISLKTGKVIFLTTSYSLGGAIAYGSGVAANEREFAFWEWDWSNPGTYSAIIDGFDTGTGWPQNFMEMSRGYRKIASNPHGRLLAGKGISTKLAIKKILKNPEHPLYKASVGVVMMYFMTSSSNGDLDIAKWNLASLSTYQAMLNGMFFGKDAHNMLKFARAYQIKPGNILAPIIKKVKDHFIVSPMKRLYDNILLRRQQSAYNQLLEADFFMKPDWRTGFRPLSSNEAAEIDSFHRKGITEWRKGESDLPDVLHRILVDEVNRKIQGSSEALIKSEHESADVSNRRRVIFPDEDVEFLNCRKAGRRRKRADLSSGCFFAGSKEEEGSTSKKPALIDTRTKPELIDISTKPELIDTSTKPELIDMFLDVEDAGISRRRVVDDGSSSDAGSVKMDENGYFLIDPDDTDIRSHPVGHAQHLALLLDKTPTTHAASKTNFFRNMFLGSLLTAKTDVPVYSSLKTVELDLIRGGNKVKHEYLETFFIKGNDIVVKYIVVQSHKLISSDSDRLKKHFKNELAKKTQKEMDNVINDTVKHKIKNSGEYKIRKYIYFIDAENSLHVKEFKPEQQQFESSQYQEPDSSNVMGKLDSYMKKIVTNNAHEMKKGIKEMYGKLWKIYNENKIKFDYTLQSESGFHGFFYGVLAFNFKYKYDLDIYVERIAGRGYADLFLLSRKAGGGKRNWRAIPIIIEFKADKTADTDANAQIRGTGYLYNLGMRTISNKAIVVGLNSNINKATADVLPFVTSDGFINKIVENYNIGDEKLRNLVEEELKFLYYSTSPLALKSSEPSKYLSRMLLGQALSRDKVYAMQQGDVSSFIFKDKKKWIMINVVESSKTLSKSESIFIKVDIDGSLHGRLPEDVKTDSITRVDIQVNPNSKHGWTPQEPKRTAHQGKSKKPRIEYEMEDLYFLHDIKVKQQFVTEFHKDLPLLNYRVATTPLKIEREILKNPDITVVHRVENVILDESTSTTHTSKMFVPIKEFINSESDFQAVLQGMFLDIAKEHLKGRWTQTFKAFPEANPSRKGRVDFITFNLQQKGGDVRIVDMNVIELKFSKGNNVNAKLLEAMDQVDKYIGQLKSLTDSKIVTPFAAVFDRKTGETKVNKLYMEVITHSSASEFSSSQDTYYSSFNSRDQTSSHDAFSSFRSRDRTSNQDINRVDNDAMEVDKLSDDIMEVVRLNDDVLEFDRPKLSDDIEKYQYADDEMGDRRKRCVNSFCKVVDFDDKPSNYMSSGASKNQAWPTNFVRYVMSFASVLSAVWQPATYDANVRPALLTDKDETRHAKNSYPKQPKATSNVLEMGDNWIRNADFDGLLTWGILIARKWTGYRPTNFREYGEISRVEIELESQMFVDEFVKMALEHASACGIRSNVLKILTNEVLRKVIDDVHDKVEGQEVAQIPQMLYNKLIHCNVEKLLLKTSRSQVKQFVGKILKDIPKLESQFNTIEYGEHFTRSSLLHEISLRNTATHYGAKQSLVDFQTPTAIGQQHNSGKLFTLT